ncbi:DUF4417 domain-containing protein [Eggerthellaceae bacterium zg-997]|nr:DUF4417 domain-containing protein [Eggerthellaceae bacterium zg-997]
MELLGRFQCVVAPDFSVYLDMPFPMKLWNVYRSRALANWWQRKGLVVAPNVTWSGPDSFDYCFDGLPRGGTVFVSTVGVQGDEYRDAITEGMRRMMDKAAPTRVLMYGRTFGFDFGKCEVVSYKPKAFRGKSG